MGRRKRFALWLAWEERCAWCKQPLLMGDMEADHLIAKNLAPSDIAKSKSDHGLPANFDLESLLNLVPAHSVCNNSKSNKMLPSAPLITLLFTDAARLAPTVSKTIEQLEKDKGIEKALATFEEIGGGDWPAERLERLRVAVRDLEEQTLVLLGVKPKNLHPLVEALGPEAGWKIVEHVSTHTPVAIVSDGIREGLTGDHESWMCPNGHPGPWNGIKCLTCGAMVPADRD